MMNEKITVPIARIFKEELQEMYPNVNEYNNGWIKCSERLPENDDYVLTYIPYSVKYIRSNCFIKDEKRWHEGDDGITYWMSLPEPPEENE
jgi:hypothetical protein